MELSGQRGTEPSLTPILHLQEFEEPTEVVAQVGLGLGSGYVGLGFMGWVRVFD